MAKALGYILLFVFGLLIAAVCALKSTTVAYGSDVGLGAAFLLLIAAPVAALLSLWLAFKLVPKDGFPRPLAFLLACGALGAMLGPATIAVLAWAI
jgi:hypothetical protein